MDDDEPLILLIRMWYTIVGVLITMLLSYLGMRFEFCLTRRPRFVEEGFAEQATSVPPPTMFSQSDSSDGEEHFPAFKEVCSVRRLAEIFE